MKITKEHFSKTAAIITIVVALLALIGWVFNIPVFKSILPQWPAMKFNAAICLLLSGITLYLLNKPSLSLTEKKVAHLFAFIILFAGLLTLSQYLFGYNAGIDELFWKDDSAAATAHPGRFPLIAALNFTMIGFIFLILPHKKFHLIVQITILLMIPGLIQTFLNYSFGTNILQFIPLSTNVAFHSAILFSLLVMGVLFSAPLSYITFSFQKKIISFFVLVIILMTLIFSVIKENQQQLIDSSQLIDHTQAVIIQSEKLLDKLTDIQSGARGFEMTGDKKFLELYTMAVKSITEQLKALSVLTIDNPGHQLKIDSLEIWIKERIYFLGLQIEARKTSRFDEVKTLIKTGQGKFYTDRIRRMIKDLQQDENDLSEKYKAVNQQNIENSKRAVVVFQIIIGIVLLIIILIIRKNTLARNKAEEAITNLNATLEKRVEEKIKEVIEKEKKFHTLFEQASDAIIIYSFEGKILDCNEHANKILGYTKEELLNLTAIDILFKEDLVKIPLRFEDLKNGISVINERRIKTKDGFAVQAEVNAKMMSDGNIMVIARDITERKKADKEKQQLFSLIETSQELIALGNLHGNPTFINKAGRKLLGIDENEELSSYHFSDFFHPDEKDKMSKEYTPVFIEKGRWEGDSALLNIKTNNKIPVYMSGFLIRDNVTGKAIGLGNVCIDITERKKAEEKLTLLNSQLRTLTGHLEKVREEERISIARDIHDELGQQLTGLKMDVGMLSKKISTEDESIQYRINNIQELVAEMVSSVKKILFNLRPSILDHFGITAAMDSFAQEFEKRHNIQTTFIASHDDLKLSPEISTELFRIFQESLTNVAMHANAKNVIATFDAHENGYVLAIEDDGIGFDLSAESNKQTYGLIGMKERAIKINANFEIKSKPGNGTSIIVSIQKNKPAN